MAMLSRLLCGIVLSCALSVPAGAVPAGIQGTPVPSIETALPPAFSVGELMRRAEFNLGQVLPSVTASVSAITGSSLFRPEALEPESGGGMMFLAALGVVAMIMRRQGASR